MKTNFLIAGLLSISAIFISCEDVDDPNDHKHDEELITTVKLNFSNANDSTDMFSVIFRDVDGPGGTDPSTWDTIQLSSNNTYNVDVQFLNEAEVIVDDITEEVIAEADEHIVCYESVDANVQITRNDSVNNLPLGIETTWVTGPFNEGQVVVSLKHQPRVKDGTCTPGETDVEVSFVTIINP